MSSPRTDGWWTLQSGFAEDDLEVRPATFDRDLTSPTQLPDFPGVRALVIGRCQRAGQMDRDPPAAIVASERELAELAVPANVEFGHTSPLCTFPIGGPATVRAYPGRAPEITVGLR